MNERPYESELPGDGVMVELFASIGFEVADEDSYNLLAEYAENSGERSRVHRGDVTLHGRCWKLSEGLEVWSILYERAAEIYYADCRPAFRSRYVHHVQPWELIEYDEDGEAIVRGLLPGGAEIIFELQNLTELNPCVFREGHLHIALAGLAYNAQVQAVGEGEFTSTRFELAERLPGLAEEACENDYFVRGRVLAWREIQNSVTQSGLVWLYVDCGKIRLEILANRRTLGGRLKIGATIAASVWLQGHVLEETEIEARYEGVDRDFEPSDFWSRLRRDN
ncbi:MAG TPA: DUF3881 family protein [Blastocatellia bacterium]|nr:DUF3881 family protein [Blastocatellia bacterium]